MRLRLADDQREVVVGVRSVVDMLVMPGWRPGDRILVNLPDGQTVRCRILNVREVGTIQVVPEPAVVVR